MAFISTVSPRKAKLRVAEIYHHVEKTTRFLKIPNVVEVFSQCPETMRRMVREWELSMVVGDEPRATRELVAVMVSRLNGCHY